jgi:hypothetical protein
MAVSVRLDPVIEAKLTQQASILFKETRIVHFWD